MVRRILQNRHPFEVLWVTFELGHFIRHGALHRHDLVDALGAEVHRTLVAHRPASVSNYGVIRAAYSRHSNAEGHTIKLKMSRPEVEIDDNQFTLISKAVADPKRFRILQGIGESNAVTTCSCVCEWTGLAPATVSHHLKELDMAGLIKMERCGKFAHITLRRDVWKAYVKRLAALK